MSTTGPVSLPPEEDKGALAALISQTRHLARHAQTAATGQAQAFEEIAGRTERLTQALAATEATLTASSDQAQQVRTTTEQRIDHLAQEIRQRLEDSARRLEAKGETARQVLEAIGAIGQSVRMLAFNARIEAARAGDQGRGFAVVAGEVGTLAAHTLDQVTQASQALDFTEVFSLLATTVEAVSQSLDGLRALSEASLGDLETLLGTITNNVAAITEHNGVIREMIDLGNATRTRALDKMDRVSATLSDVGHALHDPRQLQALAQRHHLYQILLIRTHAPIVAIRLT